jgi:hypothetical protein
MTPEEFINELNTIFTSATSGLIELDVIMLETDIADGVAVVSFRHQEFVCTVSLSLLVASTSGRWAIKEQRSLSQCMSTDIDEIVQDAIRQIVEYRVNKARGDRHE